MILRPCELSEASAFVTRLHRRHRKPVGHRFSLKSVLDGVTVGVVIVGRPVSRHQQDGETVEITRLCTDGTANACSFLIGAAKRAARALGYRRMISYTLDSEPGAAWKASGMEQTGTVSGAAWKHTAYDVAPLFGVNRNNDHPLCDKRRWEIRL
jgi:hypothetical protein